MNFSMMFKKRFLLIVFWEAVFLLSAGKVCASEETAFPENKGEILLVYDEKPQSHTVDNVERIVNILSAMGKIVDYGSVKECTEVLEQYGYIICFDLQKATEEFEQKLIKSRAERMIIGSPFMEAYLEQRGLGRLILEEETQKKGRLVYHFTEDGAYEELVNTEGFRYFQNGQYQNGSIYMGEKEYPFCSKVADVRFIPLTDFEGTLAKASLMQELRLWLWPYNDAPPDFAQYLVIDAVYPFMPADRLLDTVERMIEQGVPYVISVMPVSEHGDYPSMKQFCQVLSYAQKHNGMVILHAPLIHKKVTDIEELYEKLTEMTMVYVDNGVYPMGIKVPYSWTNEEPYREVLKRYSTVFVYDDGKASGFSLEPHTNEFCRQGHKLVYPLIALDHSGVSQLRCYSSAGYLDYSIEEEELIRIVENNRISANPLMNLWDLNHSVWLNDCWINYEDQVMYLNEERVDITYEPQPYDEEYDFGRTALQKISVNLQNQNKALLAIVVIVLVTFASFIIYARIRTRRRFFYKEQKKEWEKNDSC